MEQCREVYSALVHTVPDLWMRRGFSLCYYKQHTPCNRHGQASTREQLGTRVEEEVPGGSGRGAAGATFYHGPCGRGRGEASQESRSENLRPGMTKGPGMTQAAHLSQMIHRHLATDRESNSDLVSSKETT